MPPITALKTCPNCSADLAEHQHFCGRCGQPTHLHRFSLGHALHELFHAVTHADKGVLHLTKALATRPGVVAREYVLEGKRKRYFNPFTYLLLVLAVTLLVYSVLKPYTRPGPATTQRARVTAPAVRAANKPYQVRQQRVFAFIEKNGKLILFVAVPIVALGFWLYFWRSGLTYAEHLVANVFFAGFYVLVTTLVLVPLASALRWGSYLSVAQLGFQAVYLTWAYYQFMHYQRPVHYVRTALAAVLSLALWAVFSGGLIRLYIMYGN